jgi:hypothetical protein
MANVKIELDRLTWELHQLFRDAGPQDSEEIGRTRGRWVVALTRVATILKHVGAGDDVVEQFATLAARIHDLNNGIQHPIWVPAKTGGRPPDPTEVWNHRHTFAVALECLINAGMKEKDAANHLVRRYRKNVESLVRDGQAGRYRKGTTRSTDIGLHKSLLGWHKQWKTTGQAPDGSYWAGSDQIQAAINMLKPLPLAEVKVALKPLLEKTKAKKKKTNPPS